MSQHSPFDDLKDAADHMRQAADTMAEKILGADTQNHLREAARHMLKAARSALDQAEDCLNKKTGSASDCGSGPENGHQHSDANASPTKP